MALSGLFGAAAGAARVRFMVGFFGADTFLKRMRNYAHGPHFGQAMESSAKILVERQRQNAPAESGLLESEIEMWAEPGTNRWHTGVRSTSPAFARAVATEYGTWNYDVGTPQSPKTEWPAKSKGGAEMPWLRSSFLEVRSDIRRNMKSAHKKGLDGVRRR